MRVMLFLLILAVFSAPALAVDYDLEKAKDLAYMTGKPWLEVQGKSGSNTERLILLTTLQQGVSLEPSYEAELLQEWRRRYDDERLAAIDWCEGQAAAQSTAQRRAYWRQQADNLTTGRINFSGPGTSFDQMRAWAYFIKVYPLGTQVNDYWNGGFTAVNLPPRVLVGR